MERPYRTALTKDEINVLPVVAYEGPVVVVEEQDRLDAALGLLDSDSVLGLDTEMKPCFERGVPPSPTALLQLCGAEAAVLIRVRQVRFTERLLRLLADDRILKVGVGIEDDMRLMRRDAEFVANGLVDIAKAAKAVGVQTLGLRSLAANFLSFRISKGAQCSNWEKPVLTPQQIAYGATDAWVGREIYLRMTTMPEFVFPRASVPCDAPPSARSERRAMRQRHRRPRGRRPGTSRD